MNIFTDCRITPRASIDLNVRCRGNQTRVGFEDVSGGPVHEGMAVEVYEDESGLAGRGTVTEVIEATQLVIIAVEWGSLTDAAPTGVWMPASSGCSFTRPMPEQETP